MQILIDFINNTGLDIGVIIFIIIVSKGLILAIEFGLKRLKKEADVALGEINRFYGFVPVLVAFGITAAIALKNGSFDIWTATNYAGVSALAYKIGKDLFFKKKEVEK